MTIKMVNLGIKEDKFMAITKSKLDNPKSYDRKKIKFA